MNRFPIYISREDNARLRLLLATRLYSRPNADARRLREELDRASILDDPDLPLDVVALDSTVEFEDLDTGEIEACTLTLPDRADGERRRVSILAPIGTDLLGCRPGDVVKRVTPGGIGRLKVRRISTPMRRPRVSRSHPPRPDAGTS